MLDWMVAHSETVGTVAGAVIVILLAAVEVVRRTGSVRQALLEAMLRAERARRQGRLPLDGPAVMDLVVAWAVGYLVPRLPAWLRPWLTEERLRTWAQALYDGMLDLMDDGLLNGTKPELQGESA